MTEKVDDFLTHYGVKGMKWGVRKDRSSSGRPRRTRREEAARKDRRSAVQRRRTISEAELRKRIDRLKLEKQLKDLTAEDLNPGRAFARSVLSSSGRRIATTVATGAGIYAVKMLLERRWDPREAAAYLAPKIKK